MTAKSPLRKDTLGCSLSLLQDDRQIDAPGLTFFRKKAERAPAGRVITPASDRGFLLGVSLSGGHKRQIHHAHHASHHEFGENSVYVRSFDEDYAADLAGSFDFALLEISRASIARFADEAGLRGVRGLEAGEGKADPVLAGLMSALFAGGSASGGPSALFVEQLSLAIGLHVLRTYGGAHHTILVEKNAIGRRLSARHLTCLNDLIRSRLPETPGLEELAQACGLSQPVFLRAFRETLGTTPHQWVMQQRIVLAQKMLLDPEMPMPLIASRCGFADQAHFSRIFARFNGVPPGQWRRYQRA